MAGRARLKRTPLEASNQPPKPDRRRVAMPDKFTW